MVKGGGRLWLYGPPVPRDPEPARRALIAAAERLFAERGIRGVSLREINKAAGQRNSSALHYHFGSRQGLLRVILANHAATIRDRRLDLVEERSRTGADDAWSAAHVLVAPIAAPLEHGRSGRAFARILPQVLTDPTLAPEEVPGLVGDTARGLAYDLLGPHLEDLPSILVYERLATGQLQVVHAIADRARLLESRRRGRMRTSSELFVANLADMFLGSLLAPVSEATHAGLAYDERL
jgi:AcrR family transcriptional regulator